MKIVSASKSDAELIGQVVVAAIGPQLAGEFAGERTVDDVIRLFSNLAAREDTQYSYLHALKAIDDDGVPMGFVVGYDGAGLHTLRRQFFVEVKKILDRDMDDSMGDECAPDEFYLDSLSVFPAYRGRGIAKALISAMAKRAAASGKPLGLLCDKSNSGARRLYDTLGFRQVGEAVFAGELMDHLQIPLAE